MRIAGIYIVLMLLGKPLVWGQQDPETLLPAYRLTGALFTQGIVSSGSQYFYEEWLEGEVVLASGAVVGGKLLRYNGFFDDLIWLPSPGSQPVRVDKSLVKAFSFHLPGQLEPSCFIHMIHHQRGNENEWHFFAQRLYDGKTMVVANRQIRQQGTVSRNDGGKTYHIPLLRPSPTYLILLADGRVASLRKIRHRLFLAQFADQRKEVTELLRRQRIRVRSEQELVKAVKAIEHLF